MSMKRVYVETTVVSCANLNNPFTRMMVRQMAENERYVCPDVCPPEELLEVDR